MAEGDDARQQVLSESSSQVYSAIYWARSLSEALKICQVLSENRDFRMIAPECVSLNINHSRLMECILKHQYKKHVIGIRIRRRLSFAASCLRKYH